MGLTTFCSVGRFSLIPDEDLNQSDVCHSHNLNQTHCAVSIFDMSITCVKSLISLLLKIKAEVKGNELIMD